MSLFSKKSVLMLKLMSKGEGKDDEPTYPTIKQHAVDGYTGTVSEEVWMSRSSFVVGTKEVI
jgi:hypothetical protein